MSNEGLFTQDGDSYLPQPPARGPWSANSLHGRVVIGLLGYELERTHGGAEWMPARLTVDMYRMPDFSPITCVTRVVRGGRRIQIVDCELMQGGKSVARGTAQFLIRGENAAGKTWSPLNWDAPHPDTLPAPPAGQFGERLWKMRNVSDWFGTDETRRRGAWMAEIREMVDGVPLTPFARVAAAADFASPLANRHETGLGYINTDMTVYLHRLPVGEWIGFEKINHDASEGVAIGECFLYDVEGRIGSARGAALRGGGGRGGAGAALMRLGYAAPRSRSDETLLRAGCLFAVAAYRGGGSGLAAGIREGRPQDAQDRERRGLLRGQSQGLCAGAAAGRRQRADGRAG